MRVQSKQKGFTLLELLLAIAIAGIIGSIGVATFPGILERSRDGRRKSDLKIVASALEQFYSNNNYYSPLTTTQPTSIAVNYSSLAANPWITDLSTTYIKSMPKDPKNNSTYYYFYNSTAPRQDFILWANLERTDDSDRANSPTSNCTAAPPGGFSATDFCVQSP